MTGLIVGYGGASAPTDWLLCDGSAVSRTTYATLYAEIGTSYGVGDGSTTFNLPDCRGRIPYNTTRGTTTGVETHSLVSGEMASHSHSSWATYTASKAELKNADLGNSGGGSNTDSHYFGSTSTGSGTAHDNMPKWLAVNFIIKT